MGPSSDGGAEAQLDVAPDVAPEGSSNIAPKSLSTLISTAVEAVDAIASFDSLKPGDIKPISDAYLRVKAAAMRGAVTQDQFTLDDSSSVIGKEVDTEPSSVVIEQNPAASEEEDGLLDEFASELEKPLLGSGLAKIIEPEEDEDNYTQRTDDLRYVVACIFCLLLYIFAFSLIFWRIEVESNWSLIDAWYFSVVTIGTVGYGVLTPSNDLCRGMVVIFLTLGFVFSTFSIGLLTEYVLKKVERHSYELEMHKNAAVPCGPRVIGMCALLIIFISIGVFYGVLAEDWNFLESLYWTIVTMTTVGYGDYSPAGQVNRLCISFYIILSTGIFASVVTAVIAAYITMRKRAETVRFILRKLKPHHFQAMDKDCDGEISQKEFLEFNLVCLGYSDQWVVNMINDVYLHLDVEENGILTYADLCSRPNEEILEKVRKRHGVKAHDEHELPFGVFGLKFKFDRETQQDPNLWKGTVLPEGTHVTHDEFGRGVILQVEADTAEGATRDVRFEDGVVRKFPKPEWVNLVFVRGKGLNSPPMSGAKNE